MTHEDGEESQMPFEQEQSASLHIGSRADGHARQHNGNVYGDVHNYIQVQDDDDVFRERKWRQALLDWLSFPEIDHRRGQVAAAHADTFRWIFEDGNSTGFAEWLRHGTGIYWIQGKPASGKSTLMRYITREPRFHDISAHWAGTRRLIISSFWFWAAGSELQKSLVGLYRTLLYHILLQELEICRVAFPEWRIKYGHTEPTSETLYEAIEHLAKRSCLSFRYVFVIDGLDEYDGDTGEKTKLVDIFLTLAQCPDIKLLLSSRSEVPFATGFRHCPSLRLEECTKPDIAKIIHSRLWANPALRDVSEAEKKQLKMIEKFTIENAKGVFLWVVLVLHMVHTSINDQESFASVGHQITQLPSELEALFNFILEKKVPEKQRSESSRYLLLILEHWKVTNSMRMMSGILAIGQSASSPTEAYRLAHVEMSEYEAYRSWVLTRVKVCCHELLQVNVGSMTSSVEVLHRTFLDFLLQQQDNEGNCYKAFRARVGPDFNVDVTLMAGFIAHIRNERDFKYLLFEIRLKHNQNLLINRGPL